MGRPQVTTGFAAGSSRNEVGNTPVEGQLKLVVSACSVGLVERPFESFEEGGLPIKVHLNRQVWELGGVRAAICASSDQVASVTCGPGEQLPGFRRRPPRRFVTP